MEELIKRYKSIKQQRLIISNKEIRGIAKIFNSLKDSDQLIKDVTQTTENETKEQRGRFLSMLLDNLCLSLLENVLFMQRSNRCWWCSNQSWRSNKTREGFLIPLHSLTNLDIQRCFQKKPKFKGVYIQKKLPNTVKYGVYQVNSDKYKSIETH